MKVNHDYGYLRTGNDEDDKDEEQKTKHVIELILPYGGEYEEQFYEDCAKRENTCHQCTETYNMIYNYNKSEKKNR